MSGEKRKGHLAVYPPSHFPIEKRTTVSDQTLKHELAVMDIKACVTPAIAAQPTLRIIEFITWPLLCQFNCGKPGAEWTRGGSVVKPDGFIRLQQAVDANKFEHCFYLEVDRSTMTHNLLLAKVDGYRSFYSNGGYAIRQGAQPDQFREFPFRVLLVFADPERRNNAAERLTLHTPSVRTQVLLATIQDVLRDPLGPIWIQPVDYRDAVMGTQFDVDAGRYARNHYRRQREREHFVEATVKRCRLIEDVSNTPTTDISPVMTTSNG